ncbi:MAG TPA: 30S ribosomal protein S2 [Chloroflexota bacterium]|nr:30S ribosomal protein S2 [Chloroflexota bacterium]
MRELLSAGVHFGHKTQRWNPKMRRFIFGARNGIHIIDLQHTVQAIDEANALLVHIVQNGGRVIFVGTKRQARDAVQAAAEQSGQFYVNQRWLGGTLTNFQTIKHRLQRLRELRALHLDGAFESLSKRDMQKQLVELARLERKMGGLATMAELPDVLFLIDPRREHIAVNEARVLGIPVVALVDTNCDPDEVDLPIPCNDDSIRSNRLILGKLAENVSEAFEVYETERIEREEQERVERERQEQARREMARKRQEAEALSRAEEERAAREKRSAAAAVPTGAPATKPATKPGAKPTDGPAGQDRPRRVVQAQPAAKAAAKPAAKAAVKTAAKPTAKPAAKAAARAEEKPAAKAKAKSKAKAKTKAKSKAKAKPTAAD